MNVKDILRSAHPEVFHILLHIEHGNFCPALRKCGNLLQQRFRCQCASYQNRDDLFLAVMGKSECRAGNFTSHGKEWKHILPVFLQSDTHCLCGRGTPQHCLGLCQICHRPESIFDGIGWHLNLKLSEQIFKLKSLKPLVRLFRKEIPDPSLFHLVREIRMDVDGGQFFTHPRHIIMFLQGFGRPWRLDFLYMGIRIFNRLVFHNDFRRRLLSDTWHPRNIVGSITHQRFDVNKLLRSHLVLLLDVRRQIVLYFGPAAFRLGNPDLDLLCSKL